jgi:hypothetical protein
MTTAMRRMMMQRNGVIFRSLIAILMKVRMKAKKMKVAREMKVVRKMKRIVTLETAMMSMAKKDCGAEYRTGKFTATFGG